MRRDRWPILFLIGVLMAASMACGTDENTNGATPESESEDAAAGSGDAETYCELATKLDQAGTEFFAELEQDENATAADYKKAEKEFILANEADIDELEAAAPDEVKEDVEILIAGVRFRGGLGPPVDEQEAQAADERVRAFETENC